MAALWSIGCAAREKGADQADHGIPDEEDANDVGAAAYLGLKSRASPTAHPRTSRSRCGFRESRREACNFRSAQRRQVTNNSKRSSSSSKNSAMINRTYNNHQRLPSTSKYLLKNGTHAIKIGSSGVAIRGDTEASGATRWTLLGGVGSCTAE